MYNGFLISQPSPCPSRKASTSTSPGVCANARTATSTRTRCAALLTKRATSVISLPTSRTTLTRARSRPSSSAAARRACSAPQPSPRCLKASTGKARCRTLAKSPWRPTPAPLNKPNSPTTAPRASIAFPSACRASMRRNCTPSAASTAATKPSAPSPSPKKRAFSASTLT